MRKPTNIGASVRARLLKLARQRGQPFQVLLTRFVLERLLYRLSLTPHRNRLVLKGAMILTSWFTDPLRPTQDLDPLGLGNSDAVAMLARFREVCRHHACPPIPRRRSSPRDSRRWSCSAAYTAK